MWLADWQRGFFFSFWWKHRVTIMSWPGLNTPHNLSWVYQLKHLYTLKFMSCNPQRKSLLPTFRQNQSNWRGELAFFSRLTWGLSITYCTWHWFAGRIWAPPPRLLVLCACITFRRHLLPHPLSSLCPRAQLHCLADILSVSCSLNLALNLKDCFTT